MSRQAGASWTGSPSSTVTLTLLDDLLEGLPLQSIPELQLLRHVTLPRTLQPPLCHDHLRSTTAWFLCQNGNAANGREPGHVPAEPVDVSAFSFPGLVPCSKVPNSLKECVLAKLLQTGYHVGTSSHVTRRKPLGGGN